MDSVVSSKALGQGSTAGEAFETIAAVCLERFEHNQRLFVSTGNEEALHQVRVALRKLRTALFLFRAILADERFLHIRAELRWVSSALNDARDIDTALARIPARTPALSLARRRAHARAAKALTSPRARRMFGDLEDWLANGPWRTGSMERTAVDRPAVEFASASLDRLYRKLSKRGRHLGTHNTLGLHKLRIATKRLRYACEFFSGLFPTDAHPRREKRFIAAVRALQERLGEIHDLAVAPQTLTRLRVPMDEWPQLPTRTELLKLAERDFDRLRRRKRYWR